MQMKLEDGWQKNATWFGNIPIHPLGYRTAFECIIEGDVSLEERRDRIFGAYLQRSVSVGLMRTRPRALASICCLLQSTIGIVYSAIAASTLLPGGATCWASVWGAALAITINDGCVSAVILQKAYVVHHRPRWMLAFGVLIAVSLPVIVYVTVTSPAILGPTCACTFLYPSYYPWLRFGFYFPMDIIFSAAFIIAIRRQYLRFKTDIWKQVTQDGIQIILCMATSHLICLILVSFELFGTFSAMVLMVDCQHQQAMLHVAWKQKYVRIDVMWPTKSTSNNVATMTSSAGQGFFQSLK
ncbi:hypothetical protein THASP1DRAFT_23810 [Thamnocephalis sphaerospora]|uniref:G protein-coupled receptor n=1 Tax=Thamnocephalis sphaerospora TaxID=78915 RepID=A0A4P9XQ54_9FUNG|nr:hypothetical protein THASP1DRAFT_23810 [Thamnocephalis sphaerospora]|eukprot:RKP08148.1 hypothetical protein THASP1DRAFT_23810 [Thamnocephalis sphaerospora]